jgi:hypothetical protein
MFGECCGSEKFLDSEVKKEKAAFSVSTQETAIVQ